MMMRSPSGTPRAEGPAARSCSHASTRGGGPYGSGRTEPPPSRTRTHSARDEDRDNVNSFLPEFRLGVRDGHFAADPTTQAEATSFARALEASLSGHLRSFEMRLRELHGERQADSNLRFEVMVGLGQLKRSASRRSGP